MTYNQIRFIKKLLVVVLVCFGGMVAYQLHTSLDKRQTSSDTTQLPAEPNDPVARGVELTRLDSEGEREFVLRAAESVGRDEESQTFRDVEIEFEAGKEQVPLIINADLCRFDRESSSAHLEGNVVIRDQKSLRIETSALDFRKRPDRVWTDKPVRFFRDDMEGEAGSLYYHVPDVTWNLEDAVAVRLFREDGPPIDIVSQRAVIQRRTSLVQFVDDVVVDQGNRLLRCNDLQIYLTEDESEIDHIEAYENVELFMYTPPPREEELLPTEEAENRMRVLEEPGTKRILTSKLDVMYREGEGTVERMRAIDRGKIVFESLAEPDEPAMLREIDGYQLVFDFDTEERLTQLRGRGGVTMTVRPKDGPEEETKTVETRRFEADFDTETGELTEARCSRSVQFFQGDMRAEAELGVYDAASEMLTLTGAPRLWDPRAELAAKTIRIETVTGDLEAEEGVRTTLNRDSQNQGRGIFPTSGGGPVHFIASHMTYEQKEDLAVYTGAARGFQSDNRIEAERIELRQEEGVLEANGSVRTVLLQKSADSDELQRTVTQSERFLYDSDERVLRYRQGVAMTAREMTLNGGRINVTLEPDRDEVEMIEAEGEVGIETATGTAGGDHAKYLPRSEEVRVSGGRAWLENEDKLTEGKELTFFLSDDRIFVDGREISRTKTIYASKPRPF
jgi:LPS export ABC transporter protein LptC